MGTPQDYERLLEGLSELHRTLENFAAEDMADWQDSNNPTLYGSFSAYKVAISLLKQRIDLARLSDLHKKLESFAAEDLAGWADTNNPATLRGHRAGSTSAYKAAAALLKQEIDLAKEHIEQNS